MDTMNQHSNYLHSDITGRILRAFFNVYNHLGYGFMEKVYENSLRLELEELGLKCEQQFPCSVKYKGIVVGNFFADLVVNDLIILELKTQEMIHPIHEAQLINYLRATNIEVGLILNFGPQPQHMRRVFTNNYKA